MSNWPICEICGRSSPEEAPACTHCGSSFALERSTSFVDLDKGPKAADFGFQQADTTTSEFQEAETVFLSSLSSEIDASELGYRRENVRENGDAYYIPVGWIGCSGHLVTKSPLRLISFGSYIGPNIHIWAHYKGISMKPLGKDRRNTLKILSIRDQEKTVRVLKEFLHPEWVDRELTLAQLSLPVEVENVDLYFAIRGLHEAEEHDWFKFEVR